MFLPIPISDEPNPPQTAWATYTLIALNVAVYLFVTLPLSMQPVTVPSPLLAAYIDVMARATHLSAQTLASQSTLYDLVVFRFGFRPASPSLVALVTSQFLHAGLLHLGGNMLFLYIFGDNVEAQMGRRRFVAMYLATGVVASLFYGLARQHSELPLIGASGAISGVLGCYYVWFAFNRVRILLIVFVFFTTVTVPARAMLLFYLVVENILPFLHEISSKGGVAYGAHIGGFMAGAIYARLRAHPVHSHADALGGNPFGSASKRSLDEVANTLTQGPLDDALYAYNRLSLADSLALDETCVFELVDRLTDAERYEQALAILHRLIAGHERHRAPLLGKAHMRAGYILWRVRRDVVAAKRHFEAALAEQPVGLVGQAARAALANMAATAE